METQQAIRPGAAGTKATRVRWSILAILFLVTTINYADRATISIAGPELKKLLGLSPVEISYVFSAFAWSYVLAQLPGGWMLDRFGSKLTYFVSIFLWSLFTMMMGGVGFLTGAAAVATLFCLRLLVGGAPRRVVSDGRTRPGGGDFQFGPVLRHCPVRPVDGLAGTHLRLAERVLCDGRISIRSA